MSESNKSRRWSLLLTGKVNGCVSAAGDKFVGSPEHYERVEVVEVLQQEMLTMNERAARHAGKEIDISVCARCGDIVYDPVLVQSYIDYLYQHDETGRTTFREDLDKDIGPRWHPTPLFTHSPEQPEQQVESKSSDRRPYGDLRNAKWLDPECYGAGACQSLKFKVRYKNVDITSVLQKALDALEENNQFHIDHDDYEGYIGSEMWELNRLVTSEVREAINAAQNNS